MESASLNQLLGYAVLALKSIQAEKCLKQTISKNNIYNRILDF